MKRKSHRLGAIALALTASVLLLVLSTRAQPLQHVLFRVRVAELLLQNSTQAKDKAPSDVVELILPGQLYSPPIKLTPVQRASATWDTPLAAATADFSANKVDDGDWIVENFAPGDRAEVRALLNDAEIRKRNRAVFQTKDARFIGGTVNYMNYVLLFVRDGSSAAAPVVLTLVKTGQGYRRTNVLSKDETFDIVWAALRGGEVKTR